MIRHCQYQYHSDHIHEMHFQVTSRDSVDEWTCYLDMMHSYDESEPLLLLDFSAAGIPPVSYFIQRLREWRKMNPGAHPGYYAVIYTGNLMTLTLLKNITRILGLSISRRTRFFHSQCRAEALEWLRSHTRLAMT